MDFRTYQIVNTSKLMGYALNSRKHSEDQIKQVINSIKEFGFTSPILIDENNTIIAGHCRWEAAKRLNMDEVPTLMLDGLTEMQKKAYVIADNKLALNADWDFDILKQELIALDEMSFDTDLTGFSSDEVAALFTPPLTEGLCDEDSVPTELAESIVKKGDIWTLGNHRLMCGDSQSFDSIELLLGGNKADLLFTDPPYGVDYRDRSDKFDTIENDDLNPEEFKDFIATTVTSINFLECPYYIWCNWKSYPVFASFIGFTACIVWAKNVFGLGKGYRHQHEFCLSNAKIDDDIKDESDLWNISKDTQYMHPTQKPVALAERALKNHKNAINIVDLFGGSGSTLIACENLSRKCYVMEISEKYCDIIIARFEKYTGKKAIREN